MNSSHNKVKLVAIAKDEAAYLPEWIFHHLYYGFDAIDIYVNNTSDNTDDLAYSLRSIEKVSFIDGDSFFDGSTDTPQRSVYLAAYEQSRNSEFTHLMFLDIDEFWTPLDFKSTIHDCLNKVNADVVSFEWFIHMDEKQPFFRTFKAQIQGQRAKLVKSVIRTNKHLRALNPHNVNIKEANYRLADGSVFNFKIGESHSVKSNTVLKPFFILHRMYRSELEYVATVSKGRADIASRTIFKDNRKGYYEESSKNDVFKINGDNLNHYYFQFECFINEFGLDSILEKARSLVNLRFKETVEIIKDVSSRDFVLVNKIFQNVTLPSVKDAISKHINTNQQKDNAMNQTSSLKKADRTKIKLVAIAKDEAAYIPEWVHHHLYLGFDEIEIYVNRTKDNSESVLNKICKVHSNVSWDYADWVDSCPQEASKHIQFITYANALHRTRKEGQFSHVFFLDIDEFLIIDNLSGRTIHDIVSAFPLDTPILFEWLNDCVYQTQEFCDMPQYLEGNLSPLGKTLFPTGLKVKEFRHHVPLFECDTQVKLVDGSDFKGQAVVKQAIDESVNYLKSSFIYHRAHRSPYEYISLLYRGRPGDSFAYKSNRRGYPKLTNQSYYISLEPHNFSEYEVSLAEFISETNLIADIQEARSFVRSRYENSISNIDSHLKLDYKLMVRLFSGVNDKLVKTIFKEHRMNLIEESPRNVELLINLSKDAEKICIDEAISILNIAKNIRPKGPLIRKNLQRLLALKSNLPEKNLMRRR
ncbi:glycosyltransferase family 2 protein [Pseudoalteromonas lipolytica]|jgi:hypothetical protein